MEVLYDLFGIVLMVKSKQIERIPNVLVLYNFDFLIQLKKWHSDVKLTTVDQNSVVILLIISHSSKIKNYLIRYLQD